VRICARVGDLWSVCVQIKRKEKGKRKTCCFVNIAGKHETDIMNTSLHETGNCFSSRGKKRIQRGGFDEESSGVGSVRKISEHTFSPFPNLINTQRIR
jgi:hypothetical protein